MRLLDNDFEQHTFINNRTGKKFYLDYFSMLKSTIRLYAAHGFENFDWIDASYTVRGLQHFQSKI